MINLTSEELQRYKKLKTSDEHHNNNGTIYIDEDKKIIYKLIDTEYFFPGIRLFCRPTISLYRLSNK